MTSKENGVPPTDPTPARMSIEEARERLRARGYLDRGFEGTVLKGVMAAKSRAKGVVRAAMVAAILLSLALAVTETASLSAFGRLGLADTCLLFLWLLFGSAIAALGVVLLLLLAAWVLIRLRRDSDAVSTELGIAFGLIAGASGTIAALPALRRGGVLPALAILASTGVLVFLAVRVARSLSFTMALTAGKNLLGKHRRAGLMSASLLSAAVIAIGFFASRREAVPAAEPLVVKARTTRVRLIAIDGWSHQLLDEPLVWPGRHIALEYTKERPDPAAFWTSIGTGETLRRHGIGALDLVRLVGVSKPVQPGPASNLYLTRLLPAAGWARRESATSAARQVPAAWEISQRAGIPSLAVNWWTSYPFSGSGSTVLSNHFFFAARDSGTLAGEGWPQEILSEMAARFRPSPAPKQAQARLVSEARGINQLAIETFNELFLRLKPRLALVYLPGLDILSTALAEPGRSAGERAEVARALLSEASSVRDFLTLAASTEDELTIVILDGGRQSTSGRVLLAGSALRAHVLTVTMRPEDILPTALTVLGVPASRSASGRPAMDLLQPQYDPSWVATWGLPVSSDRLPVDSREYIENLKSLGYLQ